MKGAQQSDIQETAASYGKAQSFEDLIVWQRAHELVLLVYRLTKRFPEEERYVLTSQLRRAAISVPANIAEGFRKSGSADKMRFLNIAQGSLEETHYFLILARDLNYLETDIPIDLIREVGRLLTGYRTGIARRINSQS